VIGLLADGHERVHADVHRLFEILAARLPEAVGQTVAAGERDGMDQEIDPVEDVADALHEGDNVGVVRHVAWADQPRPDRLGQQADASVHLLAGQMIERQLGAFGVQPLRDVPRQAVVVGHAEDDALLA
jgi:hypothetical protein